MGGNGQFNRLAALDAVADDEGPWRDRLTEDQDLGLRLIGAGWEGRQELRAVVEQQGLPGCGGCSASARAGRRATSRRWGCSASSRGRRCRCSPARPGRYLLQPVLQGLVGAALVGSLGLLAFDVTPLWDDADWWQLLFFYLLGFGGVDARLHRARRRDGLLRRAARLPRRPGLRVLLVAAVAVLIRATLRQLTEQRSWSKTEREVVAS